MNSLEDDLLNKDDDVDKLVDKTIERLVRIWDKHNLEHIFDRDAVLGLADRIEKKAKEWYLIA